MADGISPPRLDDQLCFAIYAASRTMTQSYAPMLRDLSLTYPQFLVMMVLWEEDGVTVSELGDRLMLDSGTLTPLLKRLEDAGNVERQRDANDERRVRIRLTKRGTALGKRAARAHDALLCRLAELDGTAAGTPKQMARLRDTLLGLVHTLRSRS